jgi:putative flavoprotein involved in K+ transport
LLDVAVIGGGQAGLATGYYLAREGLSFAILDANDGPGGAWRHGWDSLRAFSPASWTSLPGWMMPGGQEEFPARDEVVEYLGAYEERYGLPVYRPVWVENIRREDANGESLVVEARTSGRSGGTTSVKLPARTVVSATGTWSNPYVPDYPGRKSFRGEQLHSARYRSPEPFAGQRVLVVGGGNSGAQILAEVSRIADATWVTLGEPEFLPDDVDGQVLFERATERYQARSEGRPEPPAGGLGDVVMVPPVREARDRGELHSAAPFERFTPEGVVWPGGAEEPVDAVIWCTGFRAALQHLWPLGILDEDGRVETGGPDGGSVTRSVSEPRLWLVGYGDWTGYASATVIGVGRTARSTAREIKATLAGELDRQESARVDSRR